MSKDNFEESMEKLEGIVTELENAEKKISILLEKDGEIKEEAFDAE